MLLCYDKNVQWGIPFKEVGFDKVADLMTFRSLLSWKLFIPIVQKISEGNVKIISRVPDYLKLAIF